MEQIAILLVEDEPEVRAAVLRDLAPFDGEFRIEEAEDAADAREVLRECAADDDPVGLVLCDHVLPGENGVEFLVALQDEPGGAPMRKVLLTGEAGHQDTIKAINKAGLHHYVAKPWKAEYLQAVVREQLTDYVIETQEDLTPFVASLDGARLMEALSKRVSDR